MTAIKKAKLKTKLKTKPASKTAEEPGPTLELVEFWAPWCGPCKPMGKVLNRYLGGNPQHAFRAMNVDTRAGDTEAEHRHVRGIPTLIAFSTHTVPRELGRLVGAHSYQDVDAFVRKCQKKLNQL